MDKALYQVIDSHTQAVVATCKTRAGARRSADRRDQAYGGYRFFVKADWAENHTGEANEQG